ncbi:PAS domain S-box protein [Sphingomonas sp. NBWT7]|uniref:PAS domain S-box protein n=1 Tax=Sphingomonas sp. NBWT7 TaxID=2596913 RepID=UPI00162A95AE|nr:PAS domain S-box protein [Sphingomonas sp. NBWT7]QNE30762.1 PAS domain S-box protein [Sphingomonas sp. NBWT7]
MLKTLRETADLRHLRQIIAGLDEGVILIDPDQSLLWANDAALRMHGVDSLDALGATVDDYRARFRLRYRNNHRLEADDYPIERVVAGDSFSEVVVEVTVAGEDKPRWVHQVRSLVLNDADEDEPSCVVLVIQDVTARYEAEDRFEQSFNANPAPAVICRLADLRYIKVNQGFLDMTGFAKDEVLCKTVYDIDVLREATQRDLGKERLTEGRTIPQMEASLDLPGGAKLVIVAGQPIDLGDQPCMLFTFADLEPRRKAESALRHSEERFTRTFQMAPVPMAIGSRDGHRLCEVNQSFAALTGYGATEIIGRALGDVALWATDTVRRDIEGAIERGEDLRGHEAAIGAKEGGRIDCLVSTEAITIGDDACVLWAFQDITQRKATELELVEAIEAVMKDTSWLSRSIMDKLARLRAPIPDETGVGLKDLTAREREVLALICRGLDDKTIARTLDVSGNTVRNHVARIYAKIGVNRRTAAAAWARARGFESDTVAAGLIREHSA